MCTIVDGNGVSESKAYFGTGKEGESESKMEARRSKTDKPFAAAFESFQERR